MTIYNINNPNTMNNKKVIDRLNALSVSTTEPLKEWRFLLKYEDQSHCLCGSAMRNCNLYYNKLNGCEVILGDDCIKSLRKNPSKSKSKSKSLDGDNDDLDDLDDNTMEVIETMIREKRPYSVKLMDMIVLKLSNGLDNPYMFYIVYNIRSQIDNLINRIVDNLVFKQKLEAVKIIADAEWEKRKEDYKPKPFSKRVSFDNCDTPEENRIYIKVIYERINEAKNVGGVRFNHKIKKWYLIKGGKANEAQLSLFRIV